MFSCRSKIKDIDLICYIAYGLHLLYKIQRSREVAVFMNVLVAVFCDFECPDTPLLLGSTGPLEKQLKVCKRCQFQRLDPFETKSFPRSWS